MFRKVVPKMKITLCGSWVLVKSLMACGAFTRNKIQRDIPGNNFSPLFGPFIGLNELRTHLHRKLFSNTKILLSPNFSDGLNSVTREQPLICLQIGM